jgi:ATP-dependent Clp protease ATP-binding subunit ClpC
MFERYTEKARRTIFFARYEASQFGSPYIETEHLLLGLLREDKALAEAIVPSHETVEEVRRQIESRTMVREKVSTSVDLPLSNECRRVLAYAAEEAERLSHKHIGTEHLLLGLLREEKCFATELLHQRGVRLAEMRERLEQSSEASEAPTGRTPGLTHFAVNLTKKAGDEQLGPVVGRDAELERLIQVLGRATKKSAVLVGERGVGRTSMVHGLAQRLAEGNVPVFLQERTLVALDLARVILTRQSPEAAVFLRRLIVDFPGLPQTIYFIDELHSLLAAPPAEAALSPAEIVKSALLEGRVQCISLAAPEEYRLALEQHPWLDRCFTAIEVKEPDEKETVAVLQALKARFEKHHAVTYSDEVIEYAVKCASRCIKDRFLPDKAVDLIDEAGAFMKAESTAFPEEIQERRRRIRFVVNRMESAIANHEFEKARFYSDEERKQRRELEDLYAKHKIDPGAAVAVTREAIDEVLAGWTGKSVEAIRKEVEEK